MKLKTSLFGAQKDIFFMQQVLHLAQNAFDKDEVPIGALVVDQHGKIIGKGFNCTENKNSQAAHAEIIALQKAGAKIKNWRLEGCWLYVNLEPCAMCMNMAILSRIEGVVFGAQSPLFGFHLDNDLSIGIYKKGAPKIVAGVEQDQAAQLLKRFFKTKRTINKG